MCCFFGSPPADGVHAVDSGDPEGLILGASQAVAQRAQTQALVVAAAGTFNHVAHGLPVGRADGGGEGEGARLHFLRDCWWVRGTGERHGSSPKVKQLWWKFLDTSCF